MSAAFDKDEMLKFEKKYPNLTICGKASEYYKVNDVLDHIKQCSEKAYKNMSEFQKEFVDKLNMIHSKNTQKSEIYVVRETQSYINIRCEISRRCRFAVWYKMDKNEKDQPINIKWFRTINNNHDLCHHKDSGIF